MAGPASEQTRNNQSDTTGPEADSAQTAAEPMGWSERLRQIMQRPAQGQARTNIKRQQLREDRTKAFLMLAGSTVVLGLMFFALFSSPSSSHKDNSARPNQPNLGRGPGGETADVDTLQVSMYWIRHTILTWVERNFGFAVAEAYAGHEDNGRGSRSMGAMATYVRAGLPEVATALAALTGEPHPLAIKDPGTGPAGEYRH